MRVTKALFLALRFSMVLRSVVSLLRANREPGVPLRGAPPPLCGTQWNSVTWSLVLTG